MPNESVASLWKKYLLLFFSFIQKHYLCRNFRMDAENLKNGVNLIGIHKDTDFGKTMKVVDSFCFFNIVF